MQRFSWLFQFLGFIFLSFFLNCAESKKKPQLDLHKFAVVYTDYVVAAEMGGTRQYTVIFDSVLAQHRVTEKDFKECLTYYSENPLEWEKFIQNVLEQLQAQLSEDEPQKKEVMEKVSRSKPKIP